MSKTLRDPRFVVYRVAHDGQGDSPTRSGYVIVDTDRHFGGLDFDTRNEAQRVADLWNHDYPQRRGQ